MTKIEAAMLGALREASVGEADAAFGAAQAELRRMPIDQRALALIGLFSLVVREFAALVLDHVEVEPTKPNPKHGNGARKPVQRNARKRQPV